jgi:RNA-binding protein 5/10
LEKLATRKAAANVLEQPKYRDRASERRILFNQPDAPVPEKDPGPGSTKKRHVETPSRPVTPPLPVNLGKDQSNVGNKLLKMMGWKEGTGLGTDGDGRVDPMFVYVIPFIDLRLISPLAKQPSTPRVLD